MSGGKGGSTTSTVEVPDWIEGPARQNLARADQISKIGYVPYYGPDVAALTPMQQAAAQNTAQSASAFGMATPTGADVTGVPAPQTFAGGVQGYSSAPLFEQSMETFGRERPGQKRAIDDLFIDPVSGKGGGKSSFSFLDNIPSPGDMAVQVGYNQTAADRESPNVSRSSPIQVSGPSGMSSTRPKPRPSGGGYTSIKDMFDGGGPGSSGDTFGGALGGITNKLTGRG